jgi:flagellar hook protein FlgE
MLDSIFIGMSGLSGFSQGLKVISNDTANMNTPGFKGSQLQFSDLFYSSSGLADASTGSSDGQSGYGVTTTGTSFLFTQGILNSTGQDLDLAVDGLGMFGIQDANGGIHYTRDGQFSFNTSGTLVTASGSKVMALDAGGQFQEININGMDTNAGHATTTVTFKGNLLTTNTTQSVTNIKVVDDAGTDHTLTLQLTNTSSTTPGSWSVALMDGTTTVDTGQIIYISGQPDPANSTMIVNYTAPGSSTSIPLTLDFSNTTANSVTTLTALAMASQDGVDPGGLTKTTFDTTGTLTLSYSNGQTVSGARLALGRFDSPDAVVSVNDNQFDVVDNSSWHIGYAGQGAFGTVNSGKLENSNVDLTQEFSNLVIMQRGFQASSQVITTSNDMLQQLFTMSGGK